jgi:hypothetical protein
VAQLNKCSKCGAPIIPVIGRGLVTYMFGQTLGIKPRRKTSALAVYVCPTCAFYMSLKPSPEERDFYNLSAYQIMRNLIGTDRPETQAALQKIFEVMIEREGQISEAQILSLSEPEIITMPPMKGLKAAS